MKKRIITFSILLSMLISFLCGSAIPVKAEDSKQLDIVMVLDQSGSMASNDPNGMMKTAANMLIEMMPAKTGRVGVISFNRQQTKVAELTELSDANTVDDITKRVEAIEYKGDTDIGNAVADAVEMFDENDGHIHAVLVLSDGRNAFGIEKNEEQKSDERLNDALIKAQNQQCQIYCLGFGAEMANTDDVPYKKLSGIASSGDKISTETDPKNIHEFFIKMLAELIGGKILPITNNEIEIEPNVKEANIYLVSSADLSGVSIELTDSKGNSIPLENSDKIRFYKDKYSAVIKLFAPDPGKYVISTSTDQIEISLGYVPSYEYYLSSEVVDEAGNKIEKIDNGKTAEIRTVLQQDENDVTDKAVYDTVTATAVVTAMDTGEEKTVDLAYQDEGVLKGDITFDHVALYTINITVESDSFKVTDSLQIETNKRAVSLKNGAEADQLEKKVIDKTFKKSEDLLVDNSELVSVVDDPDNVGVKIAQVTSSDEDKVLAEITDDGILLTGVKWGSSKINVTYKDGLGNSVQTSFVTKVTDKFLIAFFASLPVLIAIVVLLVIYFIMRKSRMIKGDFEINRVIITDRENAVSIVNVYKSYRAKTFVGRKKTLGNGMARYAQEVYSSDHSMPQNKTLFEMFANNQAEMKQNLDAFRFVGSYLGRKGCSVKIKKGSVISLNNNRNYGKAVKLSWPNKANFKVYTKDADGTELCIEGAYCNSKKRTDTKKKKGAPGPQPVQKVNNDFEDDFFA